ncbi:MAG: hypothetical protein L3J14_01270 [Flavobacteriaceae bacterium]|nr:hypothetical protein [Flavobacteriaceae bacterium]
MDFKEILKELKGELLTLFEEKWGDLKGESKKDVEQFLKDSKDKLERWTKLLISKDITLDDYKWLIKSQKDLLLMKALHKAGVSKISLGHFKNKVVNTILNVVTEFIL